MKKLLIFIVAAALVWSMAGCQQADSTEVPVESVSSILGYGPVGLVDRFSGVVVVSNEIKIQKDSNHTVAECFVAAGDMVEAGDILFTYDMDAMTLEMEKARLEIAKLENQIASLEEQIDQLEKDKEKASSDKQLSYTLEIQAAQTNLREAQYNLSVRQKAYELQESSMGESEVVSPISGRVQSVNSNGGTDNEGNLLPYITILETGNYRVKGTVNEMNAGALSEGMEVLIRSRVDDMTWNGYISMIDWSNPVQSNNNGYYVGGNEMTSSSKYPFYVELNSTDDLLVGQHVYIEPSMETEEVGIGLVLPSYYLVDVESGEPFVWAANGKDRLEKRNVTLGDYVDYLDGYVIVSGLDFGDSIAFPDETWRSGMKVVHYSEGQDDVGAPAMPETMIGGDMG